MKIVRDIYRDPARWRGALATQTVNPAITNYALAGVNHWLKNDLSPANSLRVSDLFGSLYVTGYFGDVISSTSPTEITQANPGVVTSKNHGYSDGQTLMMWISTGMTQLNKKKVKITKIDANSYSLDVDTSSYSSYVSSSQNYVTPSLLFDLMDQSLAKFTNDPGQLSNEIHLFQPAGDAELSVRKVRVWIFNLCQRCFDAGDFLAGSTGHRSRQWADASPI